VWHEGLILIAQRSFRYIVSPTSDMMRRSRRLLVVILRLACGLGLELGVWAHNCAFVYNHDLLLGCIVSAPLPVEKGHGCTLPIRVL
jgi:hypothetical protein